MKPLKYLYVGLVFLFFYIPILVLIVLSFNSAQYSSLWHGFTLSWYQLLSHDNTLRTVTRNSLLLSTLSATLATFIGTVSAVALFRFQFAGKRLLQALVFILIMMPDIIMGIALLVMFSFLKIPLGFFTLLLAHATFCIPFSLATIYARITDMNKHLFDAAKDLGANDLTIFVKIIFPLLLPAIAASWLLSFTISIDDVIISFFVSGPDFQILPLQIYSMIRSGITPELNALCTVLFVATLIIVLIASLMMRKKPGVKM
jgi:spermidine/putrescine transport system permease protein